MQRILNSVEYNGLRAFFEYSEDKPPMLSTRYSTKKVIQCCKLLEKLIHDELWNSHPYTSHPLYGIRIRNTITSNVWKGIILIHERHVDSFLSRFKTGYIRILKMKFPTSGNLVQIVMVGRRNSGNGRRSTEHAFPPLSGLRITRSSRLAENNVSSTAAQNVEISDRAELPQATTTLMPSSTVQNVEIPEVELTRTVGTSSMQPDKEVTEVVADQSVTRERNENLSIRHIQNLDLIEVLEDGTTEPTHSVGVTKASENLSEQKGADNINEALDLTEEIRTFLLESGLGIEGYENIKSMEDLQRVLEMETFSLLPTPAAQISSQTRTRKTSLSPEDLPQTIQVQAEVHHVPREFRSPEQITEPIISAAEKASMRQDSQKESAQKEAGKTNEALDTMEKIRMFLLESGLGVEGYENIDSIDQLQRELFPLSPRPSIQTPLQTRVTTSSLPEDLPQIIQVQAEVHPIPHQFRSPELPVEPTIDNREHTSVRDERLVEKYWDKSSEITALKKDRPSQQNLNIGENVHESMKQIRPIESETEQREIHNIDQDRATILPKRKTIIDMLLEGVSTQSFKDPTVREIRYPTQPIVGDQPTERQPEIGSEQAETRPSHQLPPRIRDVVAQDPGLAHLLVKRSPRVRKKQIFYSKKVLKRKEEKKIKPLNFISYTKRVDIWEKSHRCPLLEIFAMNYDEPQQNDGDRCFEYFKEPIELVSSEGDFCDNLVCALFEEDEEFLYDEDDEETRINKLRASIAAPEHFRNALRLSRRHPSHVHDTTKKSLQPVDQEQLYLPEVQLPSRVSEIGNMSRNVPNVSDILIEKSLEDGQNITKQLPTLTSALKSPLLGSMIRTRSMDKSITHELKDKSPILGPITKARSMKKSITNGIDQTMEIVRHVRSDRERIVTVAESTMEEVQAQVIMPQNRYGMINVPPQVIQQEEEESEVYVRRRRKRVSATNVEEKIASFWLDNLEEIRFTDLCPTGITDRFTAASTFAALLTLSKMKAIILEQEPGNSAPDSLIIQRP